MTILEYTKSTGVSLAFIAAKAGIARPHLSVLAHGKGNPTLATLRAIENATNGNVKPEDWDREGGE